MGGPIYQSIRLDLRCAENWSLVQHMQTLSKQSPQSTTIQCVRAYLR
jgi:hypothetical protein